MIKPRQKHILQLLESHPGISISKVKELLEEGVSMPTLNRDMATLVQSGYVTKLGQGPATNYVVSSSYQLFNEMDIDSYFARNPDHRNSKNTFDHQIFDILAEVQLFTPKEIEELYSLRSRYIENILDCPPSIYKKELERLTIELSWKSAEIEGNTYSLLETERLFIDKKEAEGKPKSDAIMLLNHKVALDYIMENKDIASILSIPLLEEIHSLLINDLNIERNIRSRVVGITGTSYRPLDNSYQISEALEQMCDLINQKNNGFEKALLAVVLISYIQPFEDGNKRVARMVSNALLLSDGMCPLSYRNIDSIDYKKAILLFYEQTNLTAFKHIFVDQILFSVNNYWTK